MTAVRLITKADLYRVLRLQSDGGTYRYFTQLADQFRNSGLFDNPRFSYDEHTFKKARTFRGLDAILICEAFGITAQDLDIRKN